QQLAVEDPGAVEAGGLDALDQLDQLGHRGRAGNPERDLNTRHGTGILRRTGELCLPSTAPWCVAVPNQCRRTAHRPSPSSSLLPSIGGSVVFRRTLYWR